MVTLGAFDRMWSHADTIVNTFNVSVETYCISPCSHICTGLTYRIDAEPIAGTEDLPYSKKCGPNLFNDLASELADISVEISSASAKRLYNAFQRGNDPNENLKQLHLLESLKTNNDLAKSDELIVSRVRIDQSTGRCPRSGAQLRLINLDPIQKIRFQDALLNLVSSSYQERHRNSSKPEVADKLRKFGEWLQNRSGKPFTAIIDGPNIAYYMQNFQQGTFVCFWLFYKK